MKKLKRIVIKEELVELTQDYKIAIVLQQFITYQERINLINDSLPDINDHLITPADPIEGFYKTPEKIIEDCMMTHTSTKQIMKYIAILENRLWVKKIHFPELFLIRYKINMPQIHADLFELGYPLVNYEYNL